MSNSQLLWLGPLKNRIDYIASIIDTENFSTTTLLQNNIELNATIAAPFIPSRTINQIEYRRLADKFHLSYRLGWSAGTAGSGDYLFRLPSGLTFNTASGRNPSYSGIMWLPSLSAMAPFLIPASGGIIHPTTFSDQCYIIPYDSTQFRILFAQGNSLQINSATWFPFNQEGTLTFEFNIWS